jgi:hypothetical protein
VYEFGDGLRGGVGQSNGDAAGQDDFGRVGFPSNDMNGNEDGGIARRTILLAIFFQPAMKAVHGATGMAGGVGVPGTLAAGSLAVLRRAFAQCLPRHGRTL